ncbi:hypothetical protein QJS10_CPB11g02177 [Acorus calamus]|uniref:Uncharacterized protein n=1 Tax=Acorus calamus TaxID=4465 RepID=A0AAV9DUT1_ACOCL|nr:hypothetical protein QJS10_CPB11g02177 [Acorus calamus]
MAGGGGEGSRKLDQTPTWAVAAVCAVIIVISIILEKGLHRIGEWFNERRKKALFEALEKVKSEKTADTMLPCRLRDSIEEANVGHWQRHLLEDIFDSIKSNRRGLSGGETGETCAKIRRWKEWEKETGSLDYEFSNDLIGRFLFHIADNLGCWDEASSYYHKDGARN